jgi:hypothetical protein
MTQKLSQNRQHDFNQMFDRSNRKRMGIVSALHKLGIPENQRQELVDLIRKNKWLAEVNEFEITFYKG